MTSIDVPDLIHLADDQGNSVVLRVEPEQLTGELEVRSAFVSGQVTVQLSPEDLEEWETVLDDLTEGDNTAWREGRQPDTELWLEFDEEDRLVVSAVDHSVTVELVIDVPDNWLDDHYDRLQQFQKLLTT